jgi:photosystem II stability/assembly factor-like uncharacterized protein
LGGLAAFLLVLTPIPSALANGAFPDEFSIHFPQGAPHRILVGANFGLLVSEDDGATWRYTCEPWITEGSSAPLTSTNVSFYQVTADGAVIAQSVNVTRSDDVACTWPISGGVISQQVVGDLFPDPGDASLVIAVIDVANGSYLVASHDGGKTFVDPPLYQTNALLTGIEISRTRPAVIYATIVSLSGSIGTLVRSDDLGMTWTPHSIPTPSGTEPLIMAVDPVDPETVYLRVVGALTDSIVITQDGGQSFQTALSINGQFSSFLRAEDGTLYAGTLAGQLYVRAPGATSFTNHPGPHFRCLGQRPGTSRVFACGDMGLDGFSVGYSDNGGDSFQPMMSFTDLLGPLTCSPVQTNCAAHWARIQGVLGLTRPDAGPPPDAGVDAGINDAGTTPSNPGKSGSGCNSVGGNAVTLLGLIATLLLGRTRT